MRKPKPIKAHKLALPYDPVIFNQSDDLPDGWTLGFRERRTGRYYNILGLRIEIPARVRHGWSAQAWSKPAEGKPA